MVRHCQLFGVAARGLEGGPLLILDQYPSVLDARAKSRTKRISYSFSPFLGVD